MPRRIVDKSDGSSDDPKQALERELREATGNKDMTIGYAIHILSLLDTNPSIAEKDFDSLLIQQIESFRARISAIAGGRVKLPVERHSVTPKEPRVPTSNPSLAADSRSHYSSGTSPPATSSLHSDPRSKSRAYDDQAITSSSELPKSRKDLVREVQALQWAQSNFSEEVVDIYHFVGLMLHKHMAWVYELAEYLYNDRDGIDIRVLKSAGFVALKRAIRGFEFVDGVTYESFKDSVMEDVRESIRSEIQQCKSVQNATLNKILSEYVQSVEGMPPHSEQGFSALALTLGVDNDTHFDRVVSVACKFFYLEKIIPQTLLPDFNANRLKFYRKVARRAILEFAWGYTGSNTTEFERGIWNFVTTRVQNKIDVTVKIAPS